jgi:hemoglobin
MRSLFPSLFRGLASVSLVILILQPLAAVEPLARAELDKRIADLIYETVKQGVDLFNAGNKDGCYRLYQGSATVLVGLLDHRPTTLESLKAAVAKAAGQPPGDGAFTLRAALDDVQRDCLGKKKPLWDRLGGEPAVTAVVNDFVLAAAPDPKVNFFRDGKYKLDDAGVAKLKKLLVEMISSATGGPLKYTGRTMKESHAGMKITEAEFGTLAGHLVATLQKYKVPQAELDELIAIVASTKGDIVDAKKPLWDRLGGEAAVKAVVHDFVLAAAPDPKVNFFRDGKYKLDDAGVVKLEKLLVEMISSATGGPLKYTGRSMKESHAGMKITEAEFGALAGHLIATLKKFKVPQAELDELVAIVASTKGDIVETK